MLADAYLSLQRYDEAQRELRKLLELDEHNANAWYALGQSHEGGARRAFEALRRIAPDSPYESLLIADVLASQKEYDTDDDGSLHYQLARAYQATGQAELAKTMMGEVCRAREGETKWT